ncbi:MAG TPA: hypothetical protein EYH07_18920 [Kiloniellaceae bacterium]|nr:hypothetical protein [Kiloniellaceae bacterium]HIP80519.1 hypothetical protein [Kiloniellaceae bacterium]
MLTIEDCIALSDLNEAEIEAISEHEHIPEIVAAEYGNYLMHSPEGVPMLKRIILDDIAAAEQRNDLKHALHLRLVLRRFVRAHRDLRPAAN